MVQHHTVSSLFLGALRMSDRLSISASWRWGPWVIRSGANQAREIRGLALWRKAWYPQAPVYPVALSQGETQQPGGAYPH